MSPVPRAATGYQLQEPSCVFPEFGPCVLTLDQCSILGTPDADSLMGGPMSDLICGLGGDDALEGNGGDDTLIGGSGDDDLAGGEGNDCLLGDQGDEFPGADPDVDLIERSGPGPLAGPRFIDVDEDGRCRTPPTMGGTDGGGSEARTAGGGAVDAPVRTGSLVLLLATVLQAEEEPPQDAPQEPFPVSIEPNARAENGVARLLLVCPNAAAEGTLTLTTRRRGKRRTVGRAPFTCEPPTDVVEVTLSKAARRRLEDDGAVQVTARLAVTGIAERSTARITIRPDEG